MMDGAAACCQVLGACSRVQDFERAGQWCHRIAVMCDKQNIWTVLAVSRCMYAPVLVARGQYAEAEQILETSIRHYCDLSTVVGLCVIGFATWRKISPRSTTLWC